METLVKVREMSMYLRTCGLKIIQIQSLDNLATVSKLSFKVFFQGRAYLQNKASNRVVIIPFSSNFLMQSRSHIMYVYVRM